jgi:cell division septum initiation protein DivIVA
MEILDVLEEFEKIIEESARIPMTNRAIINEEILYDFVDKFRSMLPASVREAERVLREKDRILEDAEQERGSILDSAKTKLERITGESEIVKMAITQGESIIDEAKANARKLTTGAYGYADDVMNALQLELEKILQTVRSGRDEIRSVLNQK